MLCFNSLPPELHLEIFSFLSASEVIKIRQVCKQWAVLIENKFKFKKLRCKHLVHPNDRGSEYYNFYFKSIRCFLDYTSSNYKFSRVKYLEADLSPDYYQLDDASEFLNSFKALEEVFLNLCFRYSTAAEIRKTFVISLNGLERATFDFQFESNVNVLLDLPSLLFLGLESLDAITIGHPDKLRLLAIKDLFEDGLNLSRFPNLEIIYTDGRDVPPISASFFKMLPSLKELHLDIWIYFHWLGRLRSIKRSLIEDVLLTKPPPVRANPKIFYFGFEISADQLHDEQLPDSFGSSSLYRSNEDLTRFIVRNLHRSRDNNTFVSSIHYGQLAELSDFLMFDVLLQKFPNIKHLHISDNVANENRLLRFIDSLQAERLTFDRAALSRWFFEKLLENRPFIRELKVMNEPAMNILSGDFDFVFKSTTLNWLEFENCPLPLHFVARLLEEGINTIRFCHLGSYLDIDQMSSIGISTRFGFLDFSFNYNDLPKVVNFLRAQSNANEFADPEQLVSALRNSSLGTKCSYKSYENE